MKRTFCLAITFFTWMIAPHLMAVPGAQIVGYRSAGPGCQPGTSAASISPDGQVITILFNNYSVIGGTQSEAQKEEVLTPCELFLNIKVPAGWRFMIQQVVYRGFADISQGTWGRQSSTFKWAAEKNFHPLAFQRFIGPYTGDYTTVSLPQSSVVSGCRPRVNTVQQLQVRSHIGVKGLNGFMTVDSMDHAIIEQYQLNWIPCTAR